MKSEPVAGGAETKCICVNYARDPKCKAHYEPVGASLSAQTLPTTWGHGCMNCGEEPCKCNKASVCKHCAYSIGIAKFGEFAGKYVHVLTGNWLCALSAEPLGGAVQEGDCPCGATVVRKSDSANKSKLCADCAAQEEAPSPAQCPTCYSTDRKVRACRWCGGRHKVLREGEICDNDSWHDGGVVAEEEAGAPHE